MPTLYRKRLIPDECVNLKDDKAQQDEIDRKVEEYRKRQEKDSSEIKR